MATVSDRVPERLRSEVDAALAWFNENQAQAYQVTGIIDAEETLAADPPRELKLVLCGEDTCEQRSFRVVPRNDGIEKNDRFDRNDGYEVSFSEPETDTISGAARQEIQAELDPPPGARRNWLSSAMRRHEFVVLVFYRGFW